MKLLDGTGYLGKSRKFTTLFEPVFMANTVIHGETYPAPDYSIDINNGLTYLQNYSNALLNDPDSSAAYWCHDIEYWQLGKPLGSTTATAWAPVWITTPPADAAISAWMSTYSAGWPGNQTAAVSALADITVSDTVANLFMGYYADVVEASRITKPSAKIGIYSELPVEKFGNPSDAEWNALNARAATLAAHVDFIAPDLYATGIKGVIDGSGNLRSDRVANWVNYCTNYLMAAKQYNKPVYAFLCPQYISQSLSYPFIEADFWATMLSVCRNFADGIVLWGGYYLPIQSPPTPIVWDEQASWWQETLSFFNVLDFPVRGNRFLTIQGCC